MNKIQYISVTHINKVMAKKNKSNTNLLHTSYYKEATFDEVADLLDNGCTIGRVGNTTEFLAIDIDNTSINISTVREHFKDNADYRISYSASNSPLKYHILVNIRRTIDRDDYKEEVLKEFEKIRAQFCLEKSDYMELDENSNNFYQCFFGTSVDEESEYVLEGSRRLSNWTKKDYEPEFEGKARPSLNSADYCKKNGLLTVKEEKRFDIHLPHMTNGKLKLISKGNRFKWCRMTGTKLLMRILYLNHTFNEGWTKWDLLDTFEWIVKKNVVNFDEFKDTFRTVYLWLDTNWVIYSKMNYEDQVESLEPYFNCSKRQYKSRKYNPTVMSDLILEHQFDTNTILFTDKEELHQICKDLMINYYKFIKYAKSIGYNVAFECESSKRIKHHVEGMTIEEFNEYCRNNNVHAVVKSRLKKKYNIR